MANGILGALIACTAAAGCGSGYVVRSGYYQLELLAHRKSIESALRSGEYTGRERAGFYLIRDVKRFGQEIGLAGTSNYDTIAHDWDHQVWNVSGSSPVAFENRKWTFPVVGTVPYL